MGKHEVVGPKGIPWDATIWCDNLDNRQSAGSGEVIVLGTPSFGCRTWKGFGTAFCQGDLESVTGLGEVCGNIIWMAEEMWRHPKFLGRIKRGLF